jgi:hypothetical protein
MRFAFPIALVALAACGPSKKPPYTFPGCEDAGISGSPGACGDVPAFACAQGIILERFNTCTASSDCALVLPRTTCSFFCQVAVNAGEAGAYRDQIANESSRFCNSISDGCQSVPGGGECFAEGAVCDAGRCVLTPFKDGGG